MTSSEARCQARNQFWWLPLLAVLPVAIYLVYISIDAMKTSAAKQRDVDILLQMITSTTLARVAVDEKLIVQTANPAAAVMLEIPLEDLIGSDMHDFIPPEYHRAHAEGMAKHLDAPGPIHEVECELITRKGSTIPVRLTLASIHSGRDHLFAVRMKRRKVHE